MAMIYALCWPTEKNIRYVGKTVQPLRRRLAGHIYKARSGRNKCPLGQWMWRLLIAGHCPRMYILQQYMRWLGERYGATYNRH